MKAIALATPILLCSSICAAEDVMIVTTDTVPGKTCTLVYHLPAIAQQDFAKMSYSADPVQGAVLQALQSLTQIANKLKANAVLGLRVQYSGRTDKDEGKALLMGTLAQCN